MSKEEQLHGLFGIDLISVIKKENPDWFGTEFEEQVYKACEEAYRSECEVIDWIYEAGEMDFLTSQDVKEFVKHRFNKTLKSLGMKEIFEIDQEIIKKTEWFDNEVIATKHNDFFNKRSINYNKRSASVTANDLF